MGVFALLKILILFGAIVALYRAGLPLWLALLLISAAAGLWFDAGAARTLRYMGGSFIAGETLFLAAVVSLILGFSNMLDKTGGLRLIVESFGKLLGRRMYSGAALPALIGLLPMPGGAVFSAPMVREAAGGDHATAAPEQLAAVNYWFRHIWEYWWPLYPGVILATHLFQAPMWKVALLHLPLSVMAAAGGYVFILRPAFPRRGGVAPAPGENGGRMREALAKSAPIIIVVAVMFAFERALNLAGAGGLAAKYWPVILGIVCGIFYVAAGQRGRFLPTMRLFFTRKQYSMLMMAVGVMVFRDMLINVGAFDAARVDLATYHVPAIAVIAALPFIAGLVMGLAVGFVGASFPLVISLLPESVLHSDARFAYLTLAYACGYAGMMLSPVHLCLILTRDFFKSDFLGIYRWILPPAAVAAAAGIGFFLLYHGMFS